MKARVEMEVKLEKQQLEMDKLRDETVEAKMQALKAETETKVEAAKAETERRIRDEMAAPAVSEQQLEAVQVRLEALHASKMLSDDEFFALEDLCADAAELTLETVTKEMTTMMEPVAKLHKLVLLSEKMASDAGFGRQVRRKFV
jgi:hypothetical protein